MSMRLFSTALFAGMLFVGVAAAAPSTFSGSARIISPLVTGNNTLTDFLVTAPAVGDVVTYSATYDPATLLAGFPAFPAVKFFANGITHFNMTLNGVTLTVDPALSVDPFPGDQEASLLATTSPTDVLGVPGFRQGYLFTAGNTTDANGKRWAVNVFFTGGNLANTDAPSAFPDPAQFQFVGLGFRSFNRAGAFDGFGALLIPTTTAVPGPAAVVLLVPGLAMLLARRSRRRSAS